MSTRSLIVVWDESYIPRECRAVIYRHWDGYPSEAGRDLVRVLKPLRVQNGYSGSEKHSPTKCNGVGRLAAAIVRRYPTKHELSIEGNSYPCDRWQEYEYHVYSNANLRTIELEVVIPDGVVVHSRKPIAWYVKHPEWVEATST